MKKRRSKDSEETSKGDKQENGKEINKKSKKSPRASINSKESEDEDWAGEVDEDMKSKNKRKVKRKSEDDQKEQKKNKPPSEIVSVKRDYWVEYWDESAERWICVDPWKGTVDVSESIESDVTSPMHYVIAIDNKLGMRDVTARYASKFLHVDLRRLRVDFDWWNSTMQLYRSKCRARERIESVQIHDFLMSKPMPVTVAEFKNHPLYVLKKDLHKFEAVYPEDQKPIGKVRGTDVFPRSSVHHLEGSLNWLKQARSIKPGEKPYKVVKARPDTRVPEEMRVPRTLDLYGYWQTEPYVPPEVVDGRIPRNEHGNIYMYKASMLPKGCVHLFLDGLYAVARRLDIECVQAITGWEFHKCGNHPIINGCVVLAKDEKKLRKAWTEQYDKKRERDKKRRRERAIKNWRRLFRGVIMLKRVRTKFLGSDSRSIKADEKLEQTGEQPPVDETPAEDDMALAWPQTQFELPLASTSHDPEEK